MNVGTDANASQNFKLGNGVTGAIDEAIVLNEAIDSSTVDILYDSAHPEIYVDAVHLVRVDNVPTEYIDESTGYKDLSYIDADNEPTPIPFIIDKVGPWIPDTCWVYNYEEDAWSKWRMPMTGFGYDSLIGVITIGELEGSIEEQNWRFGEKRLSEFAPTNLIGGADGQIYEISGQHIRDYLGVMSTPYVGYWESKDFDLNEPSMDKTFSRLVIYHETSHAAIDIDVGVSTDSGRQQWEDTTVTIRAGTTQTFADFFVTGPQVRFRVKSISPGFFISGFSVKLIPRGESQPY